MLKTRKMCYFILLMILVLYLPIQSIIQVVFGPLFRSFTHYNSSKPLGTFFQHSPMLRDKLLLIDRQILKDYQNIRYSFEKKCLLCDVPISRPISFALIAPVNRSLEVSKISHMQLSNVFSVNV